jgi:hypothetical protein
MNVLDQVPLKKQPAVPGAPARDDTRRDAS